MVEPGEPASAPGAHARHVARPPTGLNEPTGQGTCGVPPGQKNPASQGAHVEAPGRDQVVGAHGVQATSPRYAEKLPAAQGSGATESAGQKKPGGQGTSSSGVGQKLPSGQPTQVAFDVAPGSREMP